MTSLISFKFVLILLLCIISIEGKVYGEKSKKKAIELTYINNNIQDTLSNKITINKIKLFNEKEISNYTLDFFSNFVSSNKLNLSIPTPDSTSNNMIDFYGEIVKNNGDGLGVIINKPDSIQFGEFENFKLNGTGVIYTTNNILKIGSFNMGSSIGIINIIHLNNEVSFDLIKSSILKNNINDVINKYMYKSFIGFSENRKDQFFGTNYIFKKDSMLITESYEKEIRGNFINFIPTGTVHLYEKIVDSATKKFKINIYNGTLNGLGNPFGKGNLYQIEDWKIRYYEGNFNNYLEVEGFKDDFKGNLFVGKIINNYLEGNGKIFTFDKIFSGNFKNSNPEGNIRIDYRDGSFFEGTFSDGSAEGFGYSYNGFSDELISGKFSKGKLVSDQKTIEKNEFQSKFEQNSSYFDNPIHRNSNIIINYNSEKNIKNEPISEENENDSLILKSFIDCENQNLSQKPLILGCRAKAITYIQKCFGDDPIDGIFDERLQKILANYNIDTSNGINQELFDKLMMRCSNNVSPIQPTPTKTNPKEDQSNLEDETKNISPKGESGAAFYFRLLKGNYLKIYKRKVVYLNKALSKSDLDKMSNYLQEYGYKLISAKELKTGDFEYTWAYQD